MCINKNAVTETKQCKKRFNLPNKQWVLYDINEHLKFEKCVFVLYFSLKTGNVNS